jgi:hypothetical protein
LGVWLDLGSLVAGEAIEADVADRPASTNEGAFAEELLKQLIESRTVSIRAKC